jgi:hypothetical protein
MIVLAGMIAPTEQNERTQTRHRESTVGTIDQISRDNALETVRKIKFKNEHQLDGQTISILQE